jgi:transcriptional regulator with XRE-family HTH domain
MKLEHKIKSLRTNSNMTQEEFGAKLFVTRNAVSKWESGRGTPSIDNLQSICKLFNISLDELMTDSKVFFNNERHLFFIVFISIISFVIYLIQMPKYSYSMTLFLVIQVGIYFISSIIVLILNTNKHKQKNYFIKLYGPIITTLIIQGIIGLLTEL